MKDDNVYVKTSTGEYVPFGYRYGANYLPDGIWLVHHTACGQGSTNMDWLAGIYKVGDVKSLKIDDMELISGLEELYNKVIDSKTVRDVMNSKKGYCVADIVRATIKSIYDLKNNE